MMYIMNGYLDQPTINLAEMDEEQAMMALMGFGSFDTSKARHLNHVIIVINHIRIRSMKMLQP